jgi:RNA polymerase sigma factor (sigma-70 family)
MTASHEDAADLTQEILIRMITVLGSFRHKSSFRTWLYRIVKNHVINQQKKQAKKKNISFEEFGAVLDATPDRQVIPTESWNAEKAMVIKETKFRCMSGMLLCLDEKQRLVYILGELLEVGDVIGSEIMEVSKVNFRVMLSRARQQLYNFMNEKCGLENKNNPCRCSKKTMGFIEAGFVDPANLRWTKGYKQTIEKAAESKQIQLENIMMEGHRKLFLQHPFYKSPDRMESLRRMLASDRVRNTFNLKRK